VPPFPRFVGGTTGPITPVRQTLGEERSRSDYGISPKDRETDALRRTIRQKDDLIRESNTQLWDVCAEVERQARLRFEAETFRLHHQQEPPTVDLEKEAMKEQIRKLMQINSSLIEQSAQNQVFRPGPEGAQFGANVRPPAPPGLVQQGTNFDSQVRQDTGSMPDNPFISGATREQLLNSQTSSAPHNHPFGSPSSLFEQMQRQHDKFRQGICGDPGSENFFMLPVCIQCGTRNRDQIWECRRCGSSLKQYVSVGCTVEPHPQSSDLREAAAHNSSNVNQAPSSPTLEATVPATRVAKIDDDLFQRVPDPWTAYNQRGSKFIDSSGSVHLPTKAQQQHQNSSSSRFPSLFDVAL